MENKVESPPHFERLVLGRIDADFCKKIVAGIRKALDEIYKIYTAPNSNLLANILQHIGDLQILQNCPGVVSYR